jgi:hypothetical protein
VASCFRSTCIGHVGAVCGKSGSLRYAVFKEDARRVSGDYDRLSQIRKWKVTGSVTLPTAPGPSYPNIDLRHRLIVIVLQMPGNHAQVDLGRVQPCMPKELLDVPDIRSPSQKVHRD